MRGSVPEWLKGTDCKSVGYAYDGSNPSRPTRKARVSVRNGGGSRARGIKKTVNLNGLRLLMDDTHLAGVAQLVERQLPKLNVASSNLVSRS